MGYQQAKFLLEIYGQRPNIFTAHTRKSARFTMMFPELTIGTMCNTPISAAFASVRASLLPILSLSFLLNLEEQINNRLIQIVGGQVTANFVKTKLLLNCIQMLFSMIVIYPRQKSCFKCCAFIPQRRLL